MDAAHCPTITRGAQIHLPPAVFGVQHSSSLVADKETQPGVETQGNPGDAISHGLTNNVQTNSLPHG